MGTETRITTRKLPGLHTSISIMSSEEERFDSILLSMAQNHPGGVQELLKTFFGFLSRKTDFFHGAEPGVPRKLVLSVFKEFEEQAEKKRKEAQKEKEERERKFKEQRQREKAKEQEAFVKNSSGPQIEEITDEEAQKILDEQKENKTEKP